LTELFTISPREAAATVIATAGMYLAMLLIVRLVGQRLISSLSSFDLAAVIAFGAIIGRAALGDHPRLMTGVIALCTLVLLQGVVGVIRATSFGARVVSVKPVLLMAGSKPITENLGRCHITDAELRSRLRLAGVAHPDEVAAVIFEPSGSISVIRAGRALSKALFADVVGANELVLER
jgi:uncharacterized membrane protein YcaP (DUF421 family)